MLAQNNPINFIQGTKVSLSDALSQGNRNEFHHIFPKSYLEKLGKYNKKQTECLANFAMISRTDNNKISNKSPKNYLELMTEDEHKRKEILETHFCDLNILTNNNYEEFLDNRSQQLFSKAQIFCQI